MAARKRRKIRRRISKRLPINLLRLPSRLLRSRLKLTTITGSYSSSRSSSRIYGQPTVAAHTNRFSSANEEIRPSNSLLHIGDYVGKHPCASRFGRACSEPDSRRDTFSNG